MHDLSKLDVEEIATALSDQTDYEHRWLIDPSTGRSSSAHLTPGLTERIRSTWTSWIGSWPGLTNTSDADLLVTGDYRSVLGEVVASRFGASTAQVFSNLTMEKVGVVHGLGELSLSSRAWPRRLPR